MPARDRFGQVRIAGGDGVEDGHVLEDGRRGAIGVDQRNGANTWAVIRTSVA